MWGSSSASSRRTETARSAAAWRASTTRPPAALRSPSNRRPSTWHERTRSCRRANHPATQEVVPPPVAAPVNELEERRGRRGRSWPALVAAAVAVLLVVSAVALFGPDRSTEGAGIDGSTGGRASPATRGARHGLSARGARRAPVGFGVRRPGSGQGLRDLDVAGVDARERWMRPTARRLHRRVRRRGSDRHRSDGRDRGARVLPVRTNHDARSWSAIRWSRSRPARLSAT